MRYSLGGRLENIVKLIGNALNGTYFADILRLAATDRLEGIRLAVAYVTKVDEILALPKAREVPVSLYALADGVFPSPAAIRRFSEGPVTWRLFLTRAYYHPKIFWFEGVGAYIGSANLTDGGWYSNLECGVWFDASDLKRLGYDDQLEAMFQVIEARSAPASQEVLAAYEHLKRASFGLDRAREAISKETDRLLSFIPGTASPLNNTARAAGGEGRRAFLEEWHGCLDLLRKLTAECAQRPWPKWVSRNVPAAIAWDQATEYWFTEYVRGTRRSAEEVEKLHRQNQRDPKTAVDGVFHLWTHAEPKNQWEFWVNEAPATIRKLLDRSQIGRLSLAHMEQVVWLAHAAREHARQITNQDLGLAEGEQHTKEERSKIFAQFLMERKTEAGLRVQDVLTYVIWGDKECPDCAERIWNAATDARWKLPHIGVNILGELVGYARPDEFPPRNNRVSRCLHALGFPGIAHQ